MWQLYFLRGASVSAVLLGSFLAALAGDPAPPRLTLTLSNGQPVIQWPLFPAAQQYTILGGSNVAAPFGNAPGTVSGATFTGSNSTARFFQLGITPMSSNAVLAANVLSRLTYGPTPDDLPVVTADPQAYINQQLRPETITDETIDTDTSSETNWVYVTATGTATNPRFYIYLNGAGSVFIDDVMLVRGEVAEGGTNLLRNGDFETTYSPPWTNTADFTGSARSTAAAHSGNSSLQVVATDAGSGNGDAIFQQYLSSVNSTQMWTLSFWYRPDPTAPANLTLTVRLSGSLTEAEVPVRPPASAATLYGRLNTTSTNVYDIGYALADLRAWHVQHAVGAKRQLLEVLTQFWENHFVTQHAKTMDYLDQYYDDTDRRDRIATELEYREVSRWRAAMLSPACTFYDLLKISAESPAMILYLDTVSSRGDGNNIANENYARELLELFTFGVDNGYDQNDIVQMAKAWTGWRVRLVDQTNMFNPFAVQSTAQYQVGVTNATAISNLLGGWTFNYRSDRHNTSTKTIFPSKTVPARFGSPWAGRNYQLVLANGATTNGIRDGYQVLTNLANQPFTEEFISVKLCRLFVHDDFLHGEYDYTDPNLSPEAKLVHDCMRAWENSSPKGNLRAVLNTIFSSDLFRTQQGSLHKVKTPVEFAASTIRALRSRNPDGTYTARTDGYSISGRSRTAGSSPLARMGTMMLFDRVEPDGYPEFGPSWISAGTLAERLRFVQTTLLASGATGKTDGITGGNNNVTDPVRLVKEKLPGASWKDAAVVADYFVGLIYPGEGRANLDHYRSAAINFLNTDDTGATSPFVSLPLGGNYDLRLRGMVSMLLTFQRFQEQ